MRHFLIITMAKYLGEGKLSDLGGGGGGGGVGSFPPVDRILSPKGGEEAFSSNCTYIGP